jgi:hypothetical protein
MKKGSRPVDDDMLDEYDFASMQGGVRGKYSARLGDGTNIVVLEDDVAEAFRTDEAVNEALRAVLRAAAQVGRGPQQPEKPLPAARRATG